MKTSEKLTVEYMMKCLHYEICPICNKIIGLYLNPKTLTISKYECKECDFVLDLEEPK